MCRNLGGGVTLEKIKFSCASLLLIATSPHNPYIIVKGFYFIFLRDKLSKLFRHDLFRLLTILI